MYHSEEITPEMLRKLQAGEDNRHYKTNGSRIVFAKTCQHCHGEFWPKRRDQKYCSASCRVSACRERNGYTYQTGGYKKPSPDKQPPPASLIPQEPNPTEQKYSWQHVGESALGTAAITGVKYLAHDRPMMQKLDRVLQLLEGNVSVQTPASKTPLLFLSLHRLPSYTIALFKDPQTGKLIACDEHGRWMKQSGTQPERWELLRR